MIATNSNAVFMDIQEKNPNMAQSARFENDHLYAFNELVIKHQDSVYRQACWILGDEDAAEDATQEAFIRAYRNFHTYDGGPFRPWIMRIATNYCLDQLRRQKAHKSTSLEAYNEYDEEYENGAWLRDPSASVEETFMHAEEEQWITECIRRLSADYRAAIILVDVQEMDYQEAASVLKIPLGTFKSRLSRARAHLQKLIRYGRSAHPLAC